MANLSLRLNYEYLLQLKLLEKAKIYKNFDYFLSREDLKKHIIFVEMVVFKNSKEFSLQELDLHVRK